jgi:hypothetical protein
MDGNKMKKITLITLIVLALVISGCNFPGNEEATTDDSDDAMATEIARILTGTPVEVEEVSPTPDATEVEPTDAVEPTEIVETVEVEEPTEIVETQPVPTDTPEPELDTPTPTPTETPLPTATLADTDPAETFGTPDRVDDMTSDQGWLTGPDDFSSVVFSDGVMKLTAKTALSGWRVSWPVLQDSYLEVTFKTPVCESSDHFGVMFRVPADSLASKGYLFGVTCDGKYNLRRWTDPNMHTIINWTEDEAITTGENAINKLGILARGSNLALYINGQKVNEVNDNTYLTGKYGVFVGGNAIEDFTVWVEQIRYWINP